MTTPRSVAKRCRRRRMGSMSAWRRSSSKRFSVLSGKPPPAVMTLQLTKSLRIRFKSVEEGEDYVALYLPWVFAPQMSRVDVHALHGPAILIRLSA